MSDRLPRRYQFEFVNDGQVVTLEAEGETPCKARAKAYDDLEALLKTNATIKREGWRLMKQRPEVSGIFI